VKSLERYLGVDLVAFRLREAKAELFAAESLVEERRESKDDPAAGIIKKGTTFPVPVSFQYSLFHNLHVMLMV
jgi:hypothetical protein